MKYLIKLTNLPKFQFEIDILYLDILLGFFCLRIKVEISAKAIRATQELTKGPDFSWRR